MHNSLIILEAASEDNVSLLVGWTLDPIAEGRYKRVPEARLIEGGLQRGGVDASRILSRQPAS